MRIIAGPCQHETLEQSLEIANVCKRICEKHKIDSRPKTADFWTKS